METLFFDVLAPLVVLAAVLTVSCRKMVHSAMALGAVSAGVAVLLFLLRAEFLSLAHFLVFAAGMPSLFLLVAAALDLEDGGRRPRVWPAIGIGGIVGGELAVCAWRAGGGWAAGAAEGSAAEIGDRIFGSFLLPFGILALFLLLSLVGSVALSQREKDPARAGDSGRD